MIMQLLIDLKKIPDVEDNWKLSEKKDFIYGILRKDFISMPRIVAN